MSYPTSGTVTAGSVALASAYNNLRSDMMNNYYPACGRLSAGDGTAVTASDISDATSIYYVPFNGDKIALYESTGVDTHDWVIRKFTGATLDISGYGTSIPYDVFAYSNAGVVTLTGVKWTNSTTRATALTTQNGVYVLTGDTSRRFLGAIYCDGGGGHTQDNYTQRSIGNYYNAVEKQLKVYQSSVHTYNGEERLWNGTIAYNYLGYINPCPYPRVMTLGLITRQKAGTAGSYAITRIWADGSNMSPLVQIWNSNTESITAGAMFDFWLLPGYHYANIAETSNHDDSSFVEMVLHGSIWV